MKTTKKIKEIEKFEDFELLLNGINLIIISIDQEGKINYISPGAESIIGYKPDELLDDNWWDLTYYSNQNGLNVKNKIKAVISGETSLNTKPYDRKLKCKDGSMRWVEWRDSIGTNNSYISVGVDISYWKKNEESKIQTDAILKNVDTLVLVGNKNGEILYASPSVEKKFGFSKEHILGDNWWKNSFNNENLAEGTKHSILKYVFTGEKDFTDIHKQKIKNFDGDYLWIEWSYSKGVNGTYIAVGTDISSRVLTEIELNKAKEFAEKSLKVKNEFLANMSHEIRTPLNAVIGFTDLLLETKLTFEQKDHLETMRKSGEILLSLINNVLDLSKLESEKFEIEEVQFDLHKSIREITKLMKLRALEKNINLNLSIGENVPVQVLSDPTRIGQIFLNLIGNAIKFTNEGAVTVKVELIEDDHESCKVQFSIIDTGIGIVSNKINTVFGAFTQAKSDTSRIYGGTGLGLAIVKKLVGLLNGTINVKSKFGVGSEFEMVLPLKKGSVKVEKETLKANQDINQPLDLNILLVEDNKTNQLLARARLERWNCNVDIANNGIEGVKRTQQKLYDVILMDIQMPVMDGYEATKIIKNDISEQVGQIPIIAMTAYTSKADINRAIRAGMSDYVYKPFKPEDLYGILKKYGKVDKIDAKVNENAEENADVKKIENNYIDLKFLREETMNESSIMQMLVESFLNDIDEFCFESKQGLVEKNWERMFQAAHKIKPGISMFGISKLAATIHLLINKFRNNEVMEDVDEVMDNCFEIFGHVKKELTIELKKMKNEKV